PGRLAYGQPRDLLLGCQAVLPDGTVARAGGTVVKNVAGYDLNRLYTGSLGTLAVLTEATFKVRPLPAGRTTRITAFPSFAEAVAAALAVRDSPITPLAVAVLNNRAVDQAAIARDGGLAGAALLLVEVFGGAAALERRLGETARITGERDSLILRDGDQQDRIWSAAALP